MERVIAKYSSHYEAEAATRAWRLSLTPAQRIDILLQLLQFGGKEAARRFEFIASLNSHKVDYLVAGAFALAFHGVPRYTGVLEILVRPSPENAARLERILSGPGLSAADFLEPGRVIQLGRDPVRVDLLTSITGVPFDDAWQGRVAGELDGVPVSFLGREALIRNKRATGRAQDRADLEALGA